MIKNQLYSREYKAEDTIVIIKNKDDKDIYIGEGYHTVIAGPCAVEDRESFIETAQILKAMGADILRGGITKPRTSPYSFQGLGQAALDIMCEARKITGLPIISELMDVRDLQMYEALDIIQVGSRNMQNFSLLNELGKINKPILLKRGFAATIAEWLQAAEYILSQGNPNIILCERGIRTFETYTRNTLDINAVAVIKELSHLPIIVDPSHATGKWQYVGAGARAAVAAGADGVMVEVHLHPEKALSDGEQSLKLERFLSLKQDLDKIAELGGKIINNKPKLIKN